MNHNEFSFYDKMELARDVAMARRNKGLPAGDPAKGHAMPTAKRYGHLDALEYGLRQLEYEFESWRHEWQYSCLCAVETALFNPDCEGL